MAPMKKNRNRDRKNASVRRRGKNSNRKAHKYSGGTDVSRIGKRITGYKLESGGVRNKSTKLRKMGSGRYSKMARDGNRRISNSDDLRTKKYIRKALELGISSGYLIPNGTSDVQVLRVASEIVKFDRRTRDEIVTETNPDENTSKGRVRGGRGPERPTGGKQLVTNNRRTNLRKRGRSRTKSPKNPVAQKRRKTRSTSRGKVKVCNQKRKQTPEDKKVKPGMRKKGKDTEDNDEEEDDDLNDEEDGNNKNDDDKSDVDKKKSCDGNKKLPVSGRPGAPNSDNDLPTGGDKKNEEKEASGDDQSSEEEDDEIEDREQPEELLAEEDVNDDNEELKIDN